MKDKNSNLVVVIMAGGAGTRFWPLSTEKRPKQFLKLFGDRSLIQKSYDRVAGLVPPERVLVLTNAAFVPLVREQLPRLPEENVIGEPVRRDTAAAVALAALLCRKRFGNPVMAIMTADHIIEPVEPFQSTLLSAAAAAVEASALYTFGIKPSFPATGYGYLEVRAELKEEGGIRHFELASFKEKPDAEMAGAYLAAGRYYWNSGMFVWPTDTIISEFERNLPAHLKHLSTAIEKDGTPLWEEALIRAFEPLERISVDFAIMEKAGNVRTVVAAFSWSDVGGWLAMEEFLRRDEAGNAARGNLATYEAGSNLVFCEDEEETVAIVGAEDLIVVRSGKKTLVMPKSKAEELKKLVEGLEEDLK